MLKLFIPVLLSVTINLAIGKPSKFEVCSNKILGTLLQGLDGQNYHLSVPSGPCQMQFDISKLCPQNQEPVAVNATSCSLLLGPTLDFRYDAISGDLQLIITRLFPCLGQVDLSAIIQCGDKNTQIVPLRTEVVEVKDFVLDNK